MNETITTSLATSIESPIDQFDSLPAAPILDWIFKGGRRQHRSQLSLLLGLAGLIGLSLVSCLAGGTVWLFVSVVGWDDEPVMLLQSISVLLLGTTCYALVVLTLQAIASTLLPLAMRLTLIFAVIYACLRIALIWTPHAPIEVVHVLILVPFCFGGLFQRRWRRWRLLAWDQYPKTTSLTILDLMDFTAAAALTLMVSTALINWRELGLVGSLLLLPASLVMAVVGMHCWTRLCVLCPNSTQAESGNGIWIAINHSNAFFILIGFLAFHSQSRLAFLAFLVAPLAVYVAHLSTDISIRWLRGCGWTFERIDCPTS